MIQYEYVHVVIMHSFVLGKTLLVRYRKFLHAIKRYVLSISAYDNSTTRVNKDVNIVKNHSYFCSNQSRFSTYVAFILTNVFNSYSTAMGDFLYIDQPLKSSWVWHMLKSEVKVLITDSVCWLCMNISRAPIIIRLFWKDLELWLSEFCSVSDMLIIC